MANARPISCLGRPVGKPLTACASIALLLTSCTTIGTPALPNIPGVGYSSLRAGNVAVRTGLSIAAVPLPREAAYLPSRCSYRASVERIGGKPSTSSLSVSLSRVRERLLFQITEGPYTSTALIGSDGRLFDFNLSHFLGGQGSDAGDYDRRANAAAEALTQTSGQAIRIVNEFSIIFPHFANQRPRPGDSVSTITDSAGKTWGEYIYRGVAEYSGGGVAVFDLTTDAGQARVVRGFSLVDTATMAPVLTVMDTGSTLRFERTACH